MLDGREIDVDEVWGVLWAWLLLVTCLHHHWNYTGILISFLSNVFQLLERRGTITACYPFFLFMRIVSMKKPCLGIHIFSRNSITSGLFVVMCVGVSSSSAVYRNPANGDYIASLQSLNKHRVVDHGFAIFLACIRALVFTLLLCAGGISLRIVTLESIEIFTTHEILKTDPSVYFRCGGENSTNLPDVKETNTLYTFRGVESWQPLTELLGNKCKRCGLYEHDTFKKDDTYDEWELCPDDFKDGRYARFKEQEFNATFSCPLCSASSTPATPPRNTTSMQNNALFQNTTTTQNNNSPPDATAKKYFVTLAVVLSISASILAILAAISAYKCWLRRKRERDQARFLKLFEEGDDIEDELGLDSDI